MTHPTPNRNRAGKGSESRSQSERLPPKKVVVHGVELTLTVPDTHDSEWIDYNGYVLQLQAAWLRLSNPRIIGVNTLHFLSATSPNLR
jgi:hypothetical protein